MADITWEKMEEEGGSLGLLRAKVPNGWLVATANGAAVTYVPDLNHDWKTDVARGLMHRQGT